MDEHTLSEHAPGVEARSKHGVTRWLWFIGGLLLVGLGGIGIVVPGLPSTVFFIGAAACFTRSSPRLEQWVLNLPRIGSLVRDYRNGLGMPRRSKLIVVSTIIGAVLISSYALPTWGLRTAVCILALIGVWYILLRIPTRERVLAEREHQRLSEM